MEMELGDGNMGMLESGALAFAVPAGQPRPPKRPKMEKGEEGGGDGWRHQHGERRAGERKPKKKWQLSEEETAVSGALYVFILEVQMSNSGEVFT